MISLARAATSILFVATNMILVAGPANDTLISVTSSLWRKANVWGYSCLYSAGSTLERASSAFDDESSTRAF